MSDQTTNSTVFRRLTDPLREVGKKLAETIKVFQLTDEEKEKAGVYLDKDSSQYGERGRFSKEEES